MPASRRSRWCSCSAWRFARSRRSRRADRLRVDRRVVGRDIPLGDARPRLATTRRRCHGGILAALRRLPQPDRLATRGDNGTVKAPRRISRRRGGRADRDGRRRALGVRAAALAPRRGSRDRARARRAPPRRRRSDRRRAASSSRGWRPRTGTWSPVPFTRAPPRSTAELAGDAPVPAEAPDRASSSSRTPRRPGAPRRRASDAARAGLPLRAAHAGSRRRRGRRRARAVPLRPSVRPRGAALARAAAAALASARRLDLARRAGGNGGAAALQATARAPRRGAGRGRRRAGGRRAGRPPCRRGHRGGRGDALARRGEGTPLAPRLARLRGAAAPDLVEAAESVRRSLAGGEPDRCARAPGSSTRSRSASRRRPRSGSPSTPSWAREPGLDRLSPFGAGAALALRRSRRAAEASGAQALPDPRRGRQPGDRAALARAHARDGGRAGRGADLEPPRGGLPARGGRLRAAASRGLAGPHAELAERLLELALGPYRSRGFLFVEDMRRDPRLAGLERVVEESGVRRALFIPLLVHDEVIGALGASSGSGRAPTGRGRKGSCSRSRASWRSQSRTRACTSGRRSSATSSSAPSSPSARGAPAARPLRDLAVLRREPVARRDARQPSRATMVELLGVDAAVDPHAGPAARRSRRALVHVADAGAPKDASASLWPGPSRSRRRSRAGSPSRSGGRSCAPGTAAPEDAAPVLEPFLRQGATAAVLPLATPGEVLGTLTLVSLDPARPLERVETIDAAMAVAAQAALAIDNARLYQQQKDFAETMQRSLLPRALPQCDRARGRATSTSPRRASTWAATSTTSSCSRTAASPSSSATCSARGSRPPRTWRWRSTSSAALARGRRRARGVPRAARTTSSSRRSSRGSSSRSLYALVDAERARGRVRERRPPARPRSSTRAAGSRRSPATGLAARDRGRPGVRGGAGRSSSPAPSVVLYTDGVVEARRDGELYGEERLDRLLAERREPAGPGARGGDPGRLPRVRRRRARRRLRRRLLQLAR